MARDQMFDHSKIEKQDGTDRLRVKVGVPLVRRPAPATRAAEVADVFDDDAEDRSNRGGLSGRELR